MAWRYIATLTPSAVLLVGALLTTLDVARSLVLAASPLLVFVLFGNPFFLRVEDDAP